MPSKQESLIAEMWKLFSEQKWEEAKLLFHEDFEADWPESRERFIGAESFVNMQSAYPGNHTIEVLKMLSSADSVATAVFVHADTGQRAFASSFLEIKEGKIWKLTEFWGAPYEPPAGRELFAQRY